MKRGGFRSGEATVTMLRSIVVRDDAVSGGERDIEQLGTGILEAAQGEAAQGGLER